MAKLMRFCRGVAAGIYSLRRLDICPAFVSSPTDSTRARALPATTTLEAKTLSPPDFSTAADSPVSILSSTSKPLLEINTTSAGTSSPFESKISSLDFNSV